MPCQMQLLFLLCGVKMYFVDVEGNWIVTGYSFATDLFVCLFFLNQREELQVLPVHQMERLKSSSIDGLQGKC